MKPKKQMTWSKILPYLLIIPLAAVIACGGDSGGDDDGGEDTYTVTYDANGANGGSAPEDTAEYEKDQGVTVLGNSGNMTRFNDSGVSYSFAGWNTQANGNGTSYEPGNTFIMPGSDVTLYAKWAAYSLRDTGPAGGLVFYDQGSYTGGWRYLEAAPSDHTTQVIFGCFGTDITGAEGTAIGTGAANTNDILAGCSTADIAADVCADMTTGGYDDWFLPSINELKAMYDNLYKSNVGGFLDGNYWSSTEYTPDHPENFAYVKDFDAGGLENGSNKSTALKVRAIRAF